MEEKEERIKKTKETEYVNVTEDGGVKKKIIKEGEGEIASMSKVVNVYYTAKIGDKIIEQSNEKPFILTIGDSNNIKGWEIALQTMRVGEKSLFIFSPEYAYKDKNASELIPANSTLTFEIELLEINDKKISEMSLEEKLEKGKKSKSDGVEKFKAGDISGAKELFLKALNYLEPEEKKNPEKKEQTEKTEQTEITGQVEEQINLYVITLSNLCNCCNKEKDFLSVIQFATKGIKTKPFSKLFYFRAIAYASTEEIELAEKDLKLLEFLLTEEEKEVDTGINIVKNIIEKRKSIFEEKQKKFSRGIFRQSLYNEKPLIKIPRNPPEIPNLENLFVFLDVKIGEQKPKRIEIELYNKIVPKTCENFRCLCIGEKGEKLSYKGCKFHRVINNFIIQGGDNENNNGTGGYSIYGGKFDDENFYYGHSREGLLSMAGNGNNANGSQFFITLKDSPWLDGKHVVFGQVINGLEVVNEIGDLDTDDDDKPKIDVIIENSGEYNPPPIESIKKCEENKRTEEFSPKIESRQNCEELNKENLVLPPSEEIKKNEKIENELVLLPKENIKNCEENKKEEPFLPPKENIKEGEENKKSELNPFSKENIEK